MNTELENLKMTTISEIADNYRKQGYQVLVKPRGVDLREFLSNDDLDLIVRTEEESVIVALKPRLDRSNNKDTAEEMCQLYDYPRKDSYDIKFYFSRVWEIIEMGAIDVAICSAVFIAEAVMRMVAERYSIDFEPQSPSTLAQTFFAHSLISGEDYEILVRAIDLRDRIMFDREQIAVEPQFALTNCGSGAATFQAIGTRGRGSLG